MTRRVHMRTPEEPRTLLCGAQERWDRPRARTSNPAEVTCEVCIHRLAVETEDALLDPILHMALSSGDPWCGRGRVGDVYTVRHWGSVTCRDCLLHAPALPQLR